MPREKDEERAQDETLIAADARERAIESGAVANATGAAAAALPLRELAAAQARARGTGNVCQWLLAGDVPADRLTACREDEKPATYVAAAPRAAGGFQVVAATASGEAVLLRGPHWLLFPVALHATAELVFIDQEGIWSVALDGAAAPRLLAAGAYRHLAAAPDGRRLATVSWPAGTIVLIAPDGSRRELGARARGGLAWLDDELLVAADSEPMVVSTAGESRPFLTALACARSVARMDGALLAAAAPPCEAGIVRLELGAGEPRRILARDDAPLGIVPAGEGFLFGDAEGIHRYVSGEKAGRIGGGLTPGPG